MLLAKCVIFHPNLAHLSQQNPIWAEKNSKIRNLSDRILDFRKMLEKSCREKKSLNSPLAQTFLSIPLAVLSTLP